MHHRVRLPTHRVSGLQVQNAATALADRKCASRARRTDNRRRRPSQRRALAAASSSATAGSSPRRPSPAGRARRCSNRSATRRDETHHHPPSRGSGPPVTAPGAVSECLCGREWGGCGHRVEAVERRLRVRPPQHQNARLLRVGCVLPVRMLHLRAPDRGQAHTHSRERVVSWPAGVRFVIGVSGQVAEVGGMM